MGCCVSTPEHEHEHEHEQDGPVKNKNKNKHYHQHKQQHQPVVMSKSPPRAEEEAVKEILFSETTPTRNNNNKSNSTPPPGSLSPYLYNPIIPKISHNYSSPKKQQQPLPRSRSSTPPKKKPPTSPINLSNSNTDPINLSNSNTEHFSIEEVANPAPPLILPAEEISVSEVSEICSVSETLSTAAEIEGHEVRQRPLQQRSPSTANSAASAAAGAGGRSTLHRMGSFDSGGAPHYHPPRRVSGRSPARRSDNPSPRRGYSGGPTITRRDGGGGGLGENSARRSRSPATRNDPPGSYFRSNQNQFGRCPSARRTGISPGRVRTVQPQTYPHPGNSNNSINIRSSGGKDSRREQQKVEEEDDEGFGKWGGRGGDQSPPGPDESSLDNPLVSLECFIFL